MFLYMYMHQPSLPSQFVGHGRCVNVSCAWKEVGDSFCVKRKLHAHLNSEQCIIGLPNQLLIWFSSFHSPTHNGGGLSIIPLWYTCA